MLLPFFGVTILAAIFTDASSSRRSAYGYGESTLGRIPGSLWEQGGMGLRGRALSWRDGNPNFGAGYRSISGWEMGMRGPTSSFRYPLPRPWERLSPAWEQAVPAVPHTAFGADAEYDEYGVLTGSGGIRGMPSPHAFTAAQIAAYNREGAAQGLRGAAVAPPA